MTGWLEYDSSAAYPAPAVVDDFDNVYDDMNLVPYDKAALLGDPDQTITLDVVMDVLGNGKP